MTSTLTDQLSEQDTAQTPQFTIVGAGLAGALLACYLGRDGYTVHLREKRPDPRLHDPERGRSINLALSVRGIEALRQVGLAEQVLGAAIPMRGRMIHAATGALTFQPYGKDASESIHSVSRADLNVALIRAATRHPGVRLFFEQRCSGIDFDNSTVDFATGPKGDLKKIPFKIAIGADGAYSVVRQQLQRRERFDFQQDYLGHGYKELTIPAAPGGGFLMEQHALHIWPRSSFMMIALPNHDGSFTCTLFWPFDGPESFAALKDAADVRRVFRMHFGDALELMPDLAEQFFANPVGSLLTVRCQPWHIEDKVVLLGDACHAVVPFLGQGMNAAFEDCAVLSNCLRQHRPDWGAAFRAFEQQRKENTDALADLAIDNFLEMRDRVRSRWFLWKKRLDVLLHRLLPGWYLPLYTLITFTTVPYAAARRRARRQERIVRWLLGGLALAGAAAILYGMWP